MEKRITVKAALAVAGIKKQMPSIRQNEPMRLGSRLLPFLATFAFLLTGCSKELSHVRAPERAKPFRSMVSLSPGTTEIVARWGPGQTLVGRTENCNWPTFKELAAVPIVASEKPNYEMIAEIKPDLILFDSALYNEGDLEKLKQLGSELYPFGADTIDGFVIELQKLGSRIGMETRFAEYSDDIEAARARGQADARDPRPKVLLMMGDYIAGTKSLYADIVRAGGGEPVGPDSNKWDKVSAETIVEWNPDVLLVANESLFKKYEEDAPDDIDRATRRDTHLIKYVPSEVVRDPRYQSLTAIKKRQIASVRMDVIARRGARVDVMIEAIQKYLSGLN